MTGEIAVNEPVTTKCPNCGLRQTRTTYDIGSGAELSCSNCEWCWGANGQDLLPVERISRADILATRVDEL